MLMCTNLFFPTTGHHCGLEGPIWICSFNECRRDKYPSDCGRVRFTESCEVCDWHTEPLSPPDGRGVDKGVVIWMCSWSLLLMISFLLTSTKTCSQSPLLTGRSTILWLNLLSGGREKGMRTLQRFGKGENMGPVVLGREWIPFELLLFSDPVPDFFVCVILYLLFKPRLRSKYFNPHYTYYKTEAKGV